MFDPVITSHDALLCLLRSGHGLGARRALVADPGAVRRALDDCVIRDPRAVPATESRSLYYARLYADLGAGVDGIGRHLLCDEDWTDDDADRTALPLAVLGTLARLGHDDAVELLRAYTREGRDWPEAVDHLARTGSPAALAGLLPAVLGRADDDELYDCVQRATGMSPWRVWAAADERLRAVVEKVDLDWWHWEMARGGRGRPTGTRVGPPSPAPATVDEVLAQAAVSTRHALSCGRRLAAVAGPEHRGAILAAAWTGPDGARAAALRYLGEQADPVLLDLAEDTLAPTTAEGVRLAAAHALGGLRTDAAVVRARTWAARDDLLGDVAVRILAGAGSTTDGPLLIEALRRRRALAGPGTEDGGPDTAARYRMCDLVAGIGRLRLAEALDLVHDVYRESAYAGLRTSAVRALAHLQPDFATTTAVEALWDCEADTRLLAATHVDTRCPVARSRLRLLAADPVEADDVRSAARDRLAGT